MCSGQSRILGVGSLTVSSKEFANRLVECVQGEVSPEAFEEWFSGHSWNVHQDANETLERSVFRVEELFSAYFEGRLTKAELLGQFEDLAHILFSAPSTQPHDANRPVLLQR